MTDANAQLHLLAALDQVVDMPLRARGFARKDGGLTFTRKLNASEQEIIFVVDWFPEYQPGAEAHIHPMFRVMMPAISKAALDLVKGDKMLLAGAPEIILNQPIEFAAPKDTHVRWFAAGADEFVEACQSIVAFLHQWVLPLLSELSTPEDLVRAYESSDMRLMKQRHWHVFVAAAYQELGRTNEARETINKQFGSPGMRKRYSKLFEMIDAI
jgi:hypothetical protein